MHVGGELRGYMVAVVRLGAYEGTRSGVAPG